MAKYEWEKIKADYAAGGMNYAELCGKYGVSRSAVAARAARENWRDIRRKYREEVYSKAVGRLSELDAGKLESLVRAAGNVADMVEDISGERELFFLTGQGKSERKADTKTIREVVAIIRELASAIRDLNGIPTASELLERKAAEEKRRLEELKLAKDQQDEGVRIVIDCPPEFTG